MTSEMVERVARSICASFDYDPDALTDYEGGSLKAWELYSGPAIAAIEAMREPTVEMIAAFWRQKNTGTQEIGGMGVDWSDYAAYRATINAALKGNNSE